MSRRLSRSRLAALFVVALTFGVLLRLWLMPPTIPLTAVESKLVGNWNVVNQTDDRSLLWQFDRERKVSVLQKVIDNKYSDLWSGRWQVRDGEMQISNVESVGDAVKPKNTDFTLQFADTPDESTWEDSNGVRFRATRSR